MQQAALLTFKTVRKFLFYNRFIGHNEYRLKRFVAYVAKKYVKPGHSIIDVGAGECQYKPYFRHAKYVAQDLGIGDSRWDYSQIDIKSDIYSIPVNDESFDHLLCMEVLEHLKYPERAFAEFRRILKKNGTAFFACPLMFGEHQKPYDFYRYTQYAIRSLAEDHGFEVLEIENYGGRFILLSNIVTEIAPSFFIDRKLVAIGYVFKALLYPLNMTFAVLCFFLDKLDVAKDWTMQYEFVLRKK